MEKFWIKLKKYVVYAAAVIAIIMQTSPLPVHAMSMSGANTAWLRAKITYKFNQGVTGLSDKIITFSSSKWKKDGDWYYYQDPVESGQKIRFIEGVQLPIDWDNDLISKYFKIIITVEAAEAAPGDSGWNKNGEAFFTKSFELWNNGYEHDESIYVKEGKINVSINEFQIDENGKEVKYENDKIVTPGQHISKIVEFVISGEKGENKRLKPEKPVKTVMASNINVDGETVEKGTVLTYGITVKNPAPDTRTITITDTVDNRLTVYDTVGGTMTSGSVGGKGGTIEWTVEVEGGGSCTVHFVAQMPEELNENEGMTIPNTANATILGKELTSNTVITSLGNVTKVQQLIARATGDDSKLPLFAGILTGFLLVFLLKYFHEGQKEEK